MKRVVLGGFCVGAVLLALSIMDSALSKDVRTEEPPLLAAEPQGILKKLPLRKNQPGGVVEASFQQKMKGGAPAPLKITCPVDATPRPFDFTACGEGPEVTEIVGTLLSEDLSFIISGTTIMQPPNWQIQFSTGGPGTGVFLRAEIVDPFEQAESAKFDVVDTGGTSCDKDCGIDATGARVVAKAKLGGAAALKERVRGTLHMDTMAGLYTVKDDIVVTGKLPPTTAKNNKVYGVIVKRSAAGARAPKVVRALEIDSNADGKADRYFINFGSLKEGPYTVRIRTSKRGERDFGEQDVVVRAQ